MSGGPKMTLIAAVAIASAALGSGCGGGNPSTASSPEGVSTASNAAYIKQANAACLAQRENSLERVAAYEKQHSSESLPRHVLAENALKAAVLSTVEAEIAALEKLESPAGEEEAIEAINALLHDALDKAKGEEGLANVEGAFRSVDRQLRRYGLSACAKNG